MKAYQNDHLYCLHNALPSKLGSNTLNFDSENIAYMYAYSGIFEGEFFTNFEVCGYLRKCSPQSLRVYVFWWHQWAICESLLCKNLFSTYSEKFLALYDFCFCPQYLSIPLLHKALFLEDCWLLFTFCFVQTNFFT